MSWGKKKTDDKPELPQREAGATLSKEEQAKVREKRREVQEGYNRQWESGW